MPKPHAKKKWVPKLRQAVSTLRPTGEKRKKADCFTLLKRITRLKKEKVSARYCGQLFNTATDRVKKRKKADCFTLLRRITRLKCVNSEIKSNVGSYYLERYSPKGSCHLDEPTWVTHLLRTAFRIVDMECIVHAKKQQQNRHDETYNYIYISIITGVNDNIKQQRYTICPPQLRLKCAQGRDYI